MIILAEDPLPHGSSSYDTCILFESLAIKVGSDKDRFICLFYDELAGDSLHFFSSEIKLLVKYHRYNRLLYKSRTTGFLVQLQQQYYCGCVKGRIFFFMYKTLYNAQLENSRPHGHTVLITS